MMLSKRALFLDRDGIINQPIVVARKPFSPRTREEFQFTKEIGKIVEKARQNGYLIFVVTNQPDVARGDNVRENVEEIHRYIMDQLDVDEIFVCYHDDDDQCECRKPKPGMIIEAERKYNVDLAQSFMIGDRWRDVLAGKNAGCKTIFVDYGYDELTPANADANFQVTELNEIIKIIEGVEDDNG